ncbi:hypothetical protein E3P94_01914 [Wallemia ichthyophaga]|nr:hypothetical protein E3P95_01882 [Wallemia ichthyophaga]TIB01226.1 hypothetical protein E3P94_01914 [Wallemia ichthyophaga]
MKILGLITLCFMAYTHAIRIAIVGAGAGGSSAAYYLTKAARQNGDIIDIDVFEKRYQAGGRSRTVTPYNDSSYSPIELGASIFVGANKNMVKAVREFDYNLADTDIGSFGIYDGDSFVFESSEWTYWNYVKLLWRYGYTAPRTVQIHVKQAMEKFLQLYDAKFLRNHGPWEHPKDLVADLGLDGLVEESGLTHFHNSRFASEVVDAATRVNYGQNIDSIHALGALVSMAGNDGMAVDGGNWRVFQRFLEHSNATVYFGCEVGDIRRTSSGLWQLYLGDGEHVERLYDYVIFATPLPLFRVPYVDLYVTLVATNASTYARDALRGLPSHPPSMILTTDALARHTGKTSQLELNSVNYVQQARKGSKDDDVDVDDEWIVKIFSESPSAWGDQDLHVLFGGSQNVGWTHRHVFKAYPYLQPENASSLPPFEVDDGVFYINAMEPVLSTMESETVAARNVIGLLGAKLGYGKGWKDACTTNDDDWIWIDC